jgi:hypothetical protein
MDFGQVAWFLPYAVLSIPVIAIITGHQQKLAEIKAKATGGLSAEVSAQLKEIKEELASLRETTTKFDMAFDGALTRLEDRMDVVETHIAAAAGTRRGVDATPAPAVARSAGHSQ